ncbi:DNA excision repair protein ERCC-6-like [Sitophilus oryzae]|uniref:DNA repair and recombination protein RAD54-like n=1 Tax=Sitophilus oryzae TaxID=7048 RepID=A0A6J2XV65_SITOR|nr:DNA excision repair protein ERCC-6-like [Sitophilus oryzae]
MTEENNELQSLVFQGISLWSKSQEVLEEQASKELEIFVEQSHETKPRGLDVSKEDTKNSNVFSECSRPLNDVSLYIQQPIKDGVSLNSKCNEVNFIYEDGINNAEIDVGSSESDYIPSEEEFSDEDYVPENKIVLNKSKTPRKVCTKKISKKVYVGNLRLKDDALHSNYKARLNAYYNKIEEGLASTSYESNKLIDNGYKEINGGLKVPRDLWNKLYGYQKSGVKWLWDLHERSTGGLLGDEMGLGKTVQIIAFLHSLQYSKIVSQHCKFIGVGPTLIICPATVIHQWVKHFYEWAPEFRVAILHQSGTHQGHKTKLIDEINNNKGIIITTYAAVLKYKGNLCEYNWHYFILDEGHKIRNPNAKISVAIKSIRTPHRIMLTGSPMQNNLTELWSLFDFTNPGMLGNLATFTEHFVNPILQGGFANSSPMQEATALSVASTLKNIISPFLLRRMKNDVKNLIHLPHKSEQVLFCSLTDQQRNLYKEYLVSEQVNNILGRGIKQWSTDNHIKANMLIAITALRKICNHPDLYLSETDWYENDETSLETQYGYYKRSGKMVVVSALLKIWKKQGHRTLLFCQGRSMIKLFELFLSQQNYKYLKMDGSTTICSRQSLIDKFNTDSSFEVFLLTTRVGGLGVNLTGANRVIIYDPDWNPATDAQARERAWRIGQDKSVTVYRLISAGTVEEKMYQRQVWKQLLSKKVLVDPSTNKFFKSSDLFDLFSLPESAQANPETTNIFRESRIKMQEKLEEQKTQKKKKQKKSSTMTSLDSHTENSSESFKFSEDKVLEMKALAQKIAKSISQQNGTLDVKKEQNKSYFQKELDEERKKKLKEKRRLKHLSPRDLMDYNRWKAMYIEDKNINKLDDDKTEISFDKALEQSSKTANLYHSMNLKEIKEMEKNLGISQVSDDDNSSETEEKNQDKLKSRKRKHIVDTSGKIDGEEVEGLVKREKKKLKLEKGQNDDYILAHLFSKKGVSGALEHESVLNGGKKQQTLKDRTCAEEKALKSLEALKKSRLDNWRW